MGASRNQESTRQEKDGVVYYDRGILTGKDGRCISRATACPSPRR